MLKSFSRTCVPRCSRRKERNFSKKGDFGRGGSLRGRKKENQVEKKQGVPNTGPRKGYNILGLRTASPAPALPADSPGPSRCGAQPASPPLSCPLPTPCPAPPPAPTLPSSGAQSPPLASCPGEPRSAASDNPLLARECPSAGRNIRGPGSGALGSAAESRWEGPSAV